MSKELTTLKMFSIVKKPQFLISLRKLAKLIKSFLNKSILLISLMVNSATLKTKTSSTKTLKVSFSRLTNMNMSKVKIIKQDYKSAQFFWANSSKMNNLSAMSLIDLKTTPIKCWKTKLISKLKSMLLTNIWQTLITRTTASKRNLKDLLRLMIKSEEVLTERTMLRTLELKLMMLSDAPSKRLNKEPRDLEEMSLAVTIMNPQPRKRTAENPDQDMPSLAKTTLPWELAEKKQNKIHKIG